jgi:hypothetical protein
LRILNETCVGYPEQVGLSDEGGAGANVGFAVKQWFAPVAAEVAQLDRYINSTLWGAHCPAAPAEYLLQIL